MPVALVTGANRGIGFETARQLLERGYTVHATYRTHRGALEGIEHERLHLHTMDVRKEDEVANVMRAIGGPLDLLFNNAGISGGRWSKVDDIEFGKAAEVMEVNAISPIRVTQHALPLLRAAPGGACVAMLSSLMASIEDCSSGRSYAYRASKTALNMFTVAIKNELQADGISVVLLHPGWVETDMGGPHAPVQPHESVAGMLDRIDEQTLELSGRFVQYDGVVLPW